MTGKRFTVYDAMDARGEFRKNSANIDSKDHMGRSAYRKEELPKMFYHPLGEEQVVQPAEAVATPFGPKMVGEQKRIKSKIATTEAEAEELRNAGWHEHPALALKAAGKPVPQVIRVGTAKTLKEQMAELQKQIDESERLEAAQEGDALPKPVIAPAKKGSEILKNLSSE